MHAVDADHAHQDDGDEDDEGDDDDNDEGQLALGEALSGRSGDNWRELGD